MGIGETLKGAVKEKLGDVTGNSELETEGTAQKEKGQEQVEADKAKAEAKAHEAKAEALQQEQDALES